jgi:hypothetical protein
MPIEDLLLPFTDAFTQPVPAHTSAVEPSRSDRRPGRLAMLSVLVFAVVLAAALI